MVTTGQMERDADDTGISLVLELPIGQESISVRSSDLGSKVWSALQTLSALHRFKLDGFQCLRPDGHPLDVSEQLAAQGLWDGCKLQVREELKFRKHETVVIDKEDLKDVRNVKPERSGIEPHLWRREDREAKAMLLKQKANDILKEGGYPEAREIYSAALAWLPPEDSSQELVATLFGNRALTHLKLERWEDAKADAEKSLQLAPGNSKIEYRLGMAAQGLGDLSGAEQCFKTILDRDPEDRAVKQAFLNVQSKITKAREEIRSGRKQPVQKETPKGLKWRLNMWQQGYKLPRLQHVWRDLPSSPSTTGTLSLEKDHARALSHAWRHQAPLTEFFYKSLRQLQGAAGLHIIILGTGSMAAVQACCRVCREGDTVTIVEPSATLIALAKEMMKTSKSSYANEDAEGRQCLHNKMQKMQLNFVQSSGQLDSEFCIPASIFSKKKEAPPEKDCVLLCDRLAEDLVGERLLATMKAGKDAAQRHLPQGSKVFCLPARVELMSAPLELRCVESMDFDISKANALRFTAHGRDVPPASAVWKCENCSWRNVPQVKACELCRATQRHRPALDPQQARKQDSLGWWPIDLDTEAERASGTPQNSGKDGNGCICRLCAKEKVVCAFDFNEVIFEEQHRVLDHTFQATVLQRCHVNAVAVWWRLKGLESVVDAGPYMASQEAVSWPAKRQAIFYLGYEVGVEKDEVLQFRMHFSEEKSRIHFEMLEPRLLDRMGLIKFDVDIVNERVLQELQSKLDIKTNRLTAGIQDGSCISQQQLKTGDKLLTFGPFDLLPNTLTEDLWKKVKDRLERHSSRPKRGDQPIRCVFQHGVFEGTRRWPLPMLCDGAVIPRQPSFFEHFGQLAVAPYLTQLEHDIQNFANSGRCPRILELNSGPVPLLSMWASRCGARAWVMEAIPDLQELALETVRDHGLEMTFEQKGLANFRFFGGKLPGDPSVRVQKPLLSTALEIGDPKCLDGQRADLVVCRPEAGGPLGLDYLETMWHAFEELLEPGGRLVPSSLVAKVVAVEWMPWLDASAESTRLLQPTLGLKHEQVLLDHLKLLSSEVSIPIDLTSRQEPAISSELKAHQSGLLTSFALWHEPDSYASMSGTKEGFVTVCFVDTPQMVDKGQRIPFYLCIQDCELVAVLPPPVDKRKG